MSWHSLVLEDWFKKKKQCIVHVNAYLLLATKSFSIASQISEHGHRTLWKFSEQKSQNTNRKRKQQQQNHQTHRVSVSLIDHKYNLPLAHRIISRRRKKNPAKTKDIESFVNKRIDRPKVWVVCQCVVYCLEL